MHGASTQWTCREKAHIIFLIHRVEYKSYIIFSPKHTALLRCVHRAERSSSFSQSRILEKWKLFSVSPKRQRRHSIEHIHDMCAPRRYQRQRLFFLRFRISTELWGWACERVRSPYPQWQESRLSEISSSVQLRAKQKYYHKLSICAILSILVDAIKLFDNTRPKVSCEYFSSKRQKGGEKKVNLFIDCCYPHHIARRARRPRLDWIFSDVYTKFLIRHIQFCFIALAHQLLIHTYLIHLLNDMIACSNQIGRCLIDPSDTMRCVISVIKVSHFEMN